MGRAGRGWGRAEDAGWALALLRGSQAAKECAALPAHHAASAPHCPCLHTTLRLPRIAPACSPRCVCPALPLPAHHAASAPHCPCLHTTLRLPRTAPACLPLQLPGATPRVLPAVCAEGGRAGMRSEAPAGLGGEGAESCFPLGCPGRRTRAQLRLCVCVCVCRCVSVGLELPGTDRYPYTRGTVLGSGELSDGDWGWG
jgi:hypothetical protein